MGKRTIEGKYLSSSEKILSSLVLTRIMQNQSDTIAMHAPNGNAVLALISLTRVLHNTEEYLAFPAFFASAGGRLGQWFPAAGLAPTSRRLPRALLWATVLPLLVIAAAFVTGSHALLLAALFIRPSCR